MMYEHKIKEFAYKLDPECWKSYSGRTKEHKSGWKGGAPLLWNMPLGVTDLQHWRN